MSAKSITDKAVVFTAAVSAPILTLLVDQHVLSALAATDAGAVVAAAVGAYHGGAVLQSKAAASPPPPPVV